MRRLMLAVVLMLAGCTSPQEVIVLPDMGGMYMGPTDMMPRIEYRCPLCTKQFKTEYLAEQCIESHE